MFYRSPFAASCFPFPFPLPFPLPLPLPLPVVLPILPGLPGPTRQAYDYICMYMRRICLLQDPEVAGPGPGLQALEGMQDDCSTTGTRRVLPERLESCYTTSIAYECIYVVEEGYISPRHHSGKVPAPCPASKYELECASDIITLGSPVGCGGAGSAP